MLDDVAWDIQFSYPAADVTHLPLSRHCWNDDPTLSCRSTELESRRCSHRNMRFTQSILSMNPFYDTTRQCMEHTFCWAYHMQCAYWTMYSASMRLDAMELFLTLIHTSGAKEHVSTYQGCQESGEASGKVHTGYIGPFKKLLIPNG